MGNVTTTYKATSLAVVADDFDRRARELMERAGSQGTKVKQSYDRGQAVGFEIAASILRNTVIEPAPVDLAAETPDPASAV